MMIGDDEEDGDGEGGKENSVSVTFSKRYPSKMKRGYTVKKMGLKTADIILRKNSDASFYYSFDRNKGRMRMFTNMGYQQAQVKANYHDCKTVQLGNKIYMFPSTDAFYTKDILVYDPESNKNEFTVLPLNPQLSFAKRRINAVTAAPSHIVFIGEQESSTKSEGAALERLNVETGLLE